MGARWGRAVTFQCRWDPVAREWVLVDSGGRVCGRFVRLLDAENAATRGVS